MFRPYRAIIGPYYNKRFIHLQYILESQIIYKGCVMLQCCVLLLTLTFKNRASYLEDGRTATLQILHFIYFLSNTRTEYFKHAAHSPFFLFKMPFIS
jgi:hypothetical protein